MYKMHKGEIAFHLVIPVVMIAAVATVGYCAVILSMSILRMV